MTFPSTRLRDRSTPAKLSLAGVGILPEKMFLTLLCLERKRSERSERSFLLMLAEVGDIASTPPNQATHSRVLAAIQTSVRETDMVGWYEEGGVIGVIFTEIDRIHPAALEVVIRARLKGAFETRLGRAATERIHLSFHVFPEEGNSQPPERLIDPALYPDLFGRDSERRTPRLIKRLVDIAGSITALIIFAPVFAAIALAIKLTSPGPVLFAQERVGRYGSRFMFLKFRSMRRASSPALHRDYVSRFIAGQADDRDHVFKLRTDPRVTRFGCFLRKTSLDEIPQFINVLKGDMSLVGPRPPILYEVEMYRPWHRRRVLEAEPGITGLWQVSGRSRLKFDDAVRVDLRYARTWSLWSDLKIILKTPRALVGCDGAY